MTTSLSLSSSERSQLEGRCGNYMVDEEGEECDAGALGLVDKDPCCTADCRLRPTTPDGDTVECRYIIIYRGTTPMGQKKVCILVR